VFTTNRSSLGVWRSFCSASRGLCPKAKGPRNPDRRQAGMLEHALKWPGGSQMRKQVRSTFRTPGTEDRVIERNVQRSRGAEM
jgi:hypothetical protein